MGKMSNATDKVAQEMLNILTKLFDEIEKTKTDKERIKALKHEIYLTHQDMLKKIDILKNITGDGNKLPVICVYQQEDTKLCDYIEKQFKSYNKSDLGKENPINYERTHDAEGRSVILTDDFGKKKLIEYRMQYAVDIGGYVSQIPVKEFDELAKKNNVTIIKGLSQDQYNYLVDKTWGQKNNFSFAAVPQKDGTFSVAVLTRNYIGNTKRATKDDIFSALVSEKVANTTIDKEARQYDKDLEIKILTYEGKDPFYVTSTRNKSVYLKVEANKVTVLGKDVPIEIPKNGPLDKNFMIDVYKYLNLIDEPVLIDSQIINSLPEKGYSNIEDLLFDHSRSGNDDDLKIKKIINGKEELVYTRPLRLYNSKQEFKENFSKAYAKELGTIATTQETLLYAKQYEKCFENALIENGIDSNKINYFKENFKEVFISEFLSKNGPALSKSKQMRIVDEAVNYVTNEPPFVVDNGTMISSEVKMHVQDSFRENYQNEKVFITNAEKKRILKSANENLAKSIMVKDLTGLSKEMSKIISVAEIPLDRLPVAETKVAVNDIIDLDIKNIYLTPNDDLADKLNYENINEDIDKDLQTYIVSSKAEAEADEQMGIDIRRTATSTYKDGQDIITEDTYEQEERSLL